MTSRGSRLFSTCAATVDMSLLLPAIVAGGAWMAYGQLVSMKRDAVRKTTATDTTSATPPFWGPIGHIRDYQEAPTRGRFVSVKEDVDHLGAPIFWVDYGNGQQVLQYVDPRVLL